MNLLKRKSFISEESILLKTENFHIGATLTFPGGTGKFPGAVLAGGSMSDLRDGEIVDIEYDGPPRKAMQLLAHKLAENGYASIRWDKLGKGQSFFTKPYHSCIDDHVKALETVFNFFRMHPLIDGKRVIIVGESAGAYYTCILAKKKIEPFAYVLLGALGSTIEELYEYNYGRTVQYANQSHQNKKWVEKVAPKSLALGLRFREIFEYAMKGNLYYNLKYNNFSWKIYLPVIREQLENPPLPLFDFLKKPVLIVQGDRDMNVPVTDAELIAERIKKTGNNKVKIKKIVGADHNLQKTPENYEKRLRERISLQCLLNPYEDKFYFGLIEWLNEICNIKKG